jgi:L-alanine-DL-glutamate epimerase-like enolase superfamily enzyme
MKEIRVEKKELQFREPFAIAYETVESAPILLLTLKDEKGNVGLGSAAPDETVTGENIDDIKILLEKRIGLDFFSHPIKDRSWYENKIRQDLSGYPSAQAAVETALLHLVALQEGVSPQEYFGTCRQSCDLVVTVGIKPLPDTLIEVKKRVKDGFKSIKLKVGLDVDGDIEKIQAVRAALPTKIKLVIDANQGYSYKDARRVLKAVGNLDIVGVEQPVPADQREEFRKLRELEILPLIADELATKAEEVKFLLIKDYADGINVKMMKFGGPSSCREIIEYALERSKLVMLGCMYESNVSITAAAYLALAYPVHFVDLDSGHFDFDDDSTLGGAYVKNGILRIKGIPKLKRGKERL